MHSILLVAKREYLERVRSKVFRLTTLLVPLLVAGLMFGGSLIAKKSGGLNHLVIASNSPELASTVKDQLAGSEHPPASIEVDAPFTGADQTKLAGELQSGAIDGYLVLDVPQGQGTPTASLYSRSSADFLNQGRLEDAVSSAVVRRELVNRGISPAEAKSIVTPIKLVTLQQKNGAAVKTDTERSVGGIYALVMVLYVAVIFYGTDVARSVTEEKGSRIFEVLLSSARADSLLMGKLIGVGGAAITQVGAWFVITAILAGSNMAARAGVQGLGSLGISVSQMVYFILYFLLGFFFYSSLSAALGSTVNSAQELQQFVIFIVAPLVVSVFMMSYVMTNPTSVTSVVLSLIPPFTPIVMYLRICAQMPPFWQLGLSVVLMLASIWGIVWIASRIYRVGILMYGKRPTLPEIMRWLRYS